MNLEITSNEPRWIDPQITVLGNEENLQDEMENDPEIFPPPIFLAFEMVISTVLVARHECSVSKYIFIKGVFKEPDFVYNTKDARHEWLPVVPDTHDEDFSNLEFDDLFPKAFRILQFFCVGLEQTLFDQRKYKGRFRRLFADIENIIIDTLYEINKGMTLLRLEPQENVTRDDMPLEFRNIEDENERNMRDYLLLRDLVIATNFVFHLFLFGDPHLFDFEGF